MLRALLNNKVEAINMDELKSDVRPFIKDQDRLDAWRIELFKAAFAKIAAC